MIGSLSHFFHSIFNVQGLVESGGPLLVCLIVFMETGFFAGFFVPGDSLLVIAGVFAGNGYPNLAKLLLLVPLCAIVGDQIGYWIGRKAGQALYRREDSFIFRKRHLERAKQFYEKYGGKTVIMARFMPIVRTFCPPVTGAAMMPYPRYVTYDIVGGYLWVGSMILGGYFLGRQDKNIGAHIHYVIAPFIFVSFLPPVIGVLRANFPGNPSASFAPPPPAPRYPSL